MSNYLFTNFFHFCRLRKSDDQPEKKSDAAAKGTTLAPMVPRNVAVAQKNQPPKPVPPVPEIPTVPQKSPVVASQKSPAHVPKPPSTPPKSPAQTSRKSITFSAPSIRP